MKPLTDRYIYAVIRRLPEDSRPEVEKELRANIADMLGEDPSQEDVKRVLASLGDPARLAEQYRQRPRYLISPALFDDYLTVLKLVIPILAVVMIAVQLFGTLVGSPIDGAPSQVISSVISDILTSLFSAVTTGFLYVTLGFALFDYLAGVKGKKEWSPENLPDIPPQSAAKISRVDIVLDMVFSALLLILLAKYPHFFSWRQSGPPAINIQLFNNETLSGYIPYLGALTLCSWAVDVVKLYYGRWNNLIAAVSSIKGILWAVAFILFVRSPYTFNPDFIAHLANVLHIDMSTMNSHWNTGTVVASVISLIGAAIEAISNFFKARKGLALNK